MTSDEVRAEMRRIDALISKGENPFGSGERPIEQTVRDVQNELDYLLNRVQDKRGEHRNKYLPILRKKDSSRPCPFHAEQMETLDIEASLEASYGPDSLHVVYTPCPECQHNRLVNEKFRAWILRGVPKKVAHATFDNYVTNGNDQKIKAKQKVMTICERGSGFVLLTGDPGTGKSHLATALFKAHFKQDGIFLTQADLLGQLRETYDTGGTEKLVKKLQKANIFILDELDEALGGGETGRGQDIGPFLYRVLAYRYDRDLITGLTSNHDLTKVLSILGPRLEDRMAQNYVAASLTGPSYRRENRVK